MRRAAASLAVLLVASACGMSTVESTAVKQCSANADCPTGDSCQFSVYESCPDPASEPTGVCIRTPDGSACVPQVACACNGDTVMVCLVNGNAPSPVIALGSCDGATQQQGFDADVSPPPDATTSSSPDAADSSTSTMLPQDSAPPPQDSAPPPIDAADSAPASTLGSPCTSSLECTDPVYNTCKSISGTKICTTTCFIDSNCQPPADGFCDADGYCELQ